MQELQKRIDEEQELRPHIIIITEAKPKNFRYPVQEAELQILGYQIISTDLEASRGRGVVIYTADNLKVTVINKQSEFTEICGIKIELSKGKCTEIWAIYRSPNSSNEENEALLEVLQQINDSNPPNLIITGDFNFPDINWENNGTTPSETSTAAKFIEKIQNCFWNQHVDKPTRVREGTIPSLLDLVITNNEELIGPIGYDSPLGGSDHCLLKFELQQETCTITDNPNPIHNWGKANYHMLREGLTREWDFLELSQSVEDQWNSFERITSHLIKEHVPVFKSFGKSAKVPLTPDLKSKIRRKHLTWRRYMETREESKYKEYTRARNKLKNALRAAKRSLERNIAESIKENPKKFWKHVRMTTSTRSIIPDLERSEGGKASTDKDKAETLAKFFSSVMVHEPEGPLPHLERFAYPHEWGKLITEDEVMKKLKELNQNKSPGQDNIHPRFLRETATQICKPLTSIFNRSIKEKSLPNSWKKAIITPIHKKGSKSIPDNYRPVSLTSVICKILEKLIRDQIMLYMKTYNLITDKQYGFMGGRSTVLQLLKILDDWTDSMDNGKSTEVIYMDFKKAFDSVPHRRLIYKIECLGIKDPILSWLRAFLENRRQAVRISGVTSEEHQILSGIPQGSVLGPVLFVLYINDLPNSLTTNSFMFADDTKIYQSYPRNEPPPTSIQDDLKLLEIWSKTWLLQFHPQKCHQLIISNNYQFTPRTIEDTVLSCVKCEKDLGIMVDDNLNFDRHIEVICNKARKVMGIIRRTFTHLTPEVFRPLYIALVRSHLEYGQAVWSPHSMKNIKKLESVQRSATKLVNGLKNLSYEERLKRLNLPTLRYRRRRGDLIETFKVVHKIYDPECSPVLVRSTRISRGHSFKLFKRPVQRLDIRKYFFTNRVIDMWNNLPEEVVSANTLNSFKNRLDRFWKNEEIKFNPGF